MSDFRPAFEFMIRHEGGYVNDPHDAGGETNWGISKRAYPELDIKTLTQEDAAQIYQRDYWQPHPYGMIESQGVADKVFDFAVNMGFNRAHKLLQSSCNECGQLTTVDGGFGPVTLRATNACDPKRLIDELKASASKFYMTLASERPTNQKFLNGWLTRANA